MTNPSTPARVERAAVVAWLRSDRGQRVGYFKLTDGLADAIERGEHHKEQGE